MALWDGPDTLAALKREMGLQDANEMDDTTDLYPRLSRAQQTLTQEIAIRYPQCLYPAPFTLTAAGDRKTFTFGTDINGSAIVPMGWVQISPRVTAFGGGRFVGWEENVDFLDEGIRIRIANNRAFSGTLYCRAVLTPPNITALVAPTITPALARSLIPIIATREFALEGNQNPSLAAAMATKWKDQFPPLMMALRQRYKGGGGGFDPARWYLSVDLGAST